MTCHFGTYSATDQAKHFLEPILNMSVLSGRLMAKDDSNFVVNLWKVYAVSGNGDHVTARVAQEREAEITADGEMTLESTLTGRVTRVLKFSTRRPLMATLSRFHWLARSSRSTPKKTRQSPLGSP